MKKNKMVKMKKNIAGLMSKTKALVIFLLINLFVPLNVCAANYNLATTNIPFLSSLFRMISDLGEGLAIGAGVVTILVLLIDGYQWLVADGQAKASKAKKCGIDLGVGGFIVVTGAVVDWAFGYFG